MNSHSKGNYILLLLEQPRVARVLKVESECNRNMVSSYKNAGVIFFNLRNISDMHVKDKLLESMQESDCKLSFLDQDLLNIAFHNYMYPLSMRWNFCTSFNDKSLYFSYFILHYAGRKPWIPSEQELWQTNPEKIIDINKYYWRYREITPWGNKDFN
ncbi:MAG: glycosyltransferase [Rickettsia endosymbiont of Pentastiridius leporinus]